MGVAVGGKRRRRRGVLGDSNFTFPCMLYSATGDNTMINLTKSDLKKKKMENCKTRKDFFQTSAIRKRASVLFFCDALTFILHDQYFQPL